MNFEYRSKKQPRWSIAEGIDDGTEHEELTTLIEGWVDLVEYLIDENLSMSMFRTQPQPHQGGSRGNMRDDSSGRKGSADCN